MFMFMCMWNVLVFDIYIGICHWLKLLLLSGFQREKHSMPSVQKPDQILADSSEIYLDKLGGHTPAVNFSNDVPVNNGLGTQVAPVGIMRSNYLSNPFPFAGNSGSPFQVSL